MAIIKIFSKLTSDIKLLILPIIVIISILILSFIFSQKIQILKKEVNLIYFGNFTPINKLHIIKEQYINLINNPTDISEYKQIILKNWIYYNKQYKSKDEKQVSDKINHQLLTSLQSKNINRYKTTLKNINFLLKYEQDSAYLQRRNFLLKYKQMEDYIFYSQILIIIFVLMFMVIIIYNAITHNKALALLNEKYKIEANTDGLTTLYNRKYFDTVFKDLTSISSSNNWNSVFVMIDIDFFKQYNDTYGHDAGDIALKKVATTLDIYFNKKYEYTFRLGGEEFGIIIFNASINYIKSSLDNLQNQIQRLQIEHKASATKYLTLSMGVISIDKNTYKLSTKELYKKADEKLYFSKENGRNKYTI